MVVGFLRSFTDCEERILVMPFGMLFGKYRTDTRTDSGARPILDCYLVSARCIYARGSTSLLAGLLYCYPYWVLRVDNGWLAAAC